MTKIVLDDAELPKYWYNIIPDLPKPLPEPKEPGDGVSRMEFLERVMIKECLKQEFSNERWVAIPNELIELYLHVGRPRPLYRAERLERRLGLSKVKIFYKREDLSPPGSHKLNTALAQAYYAKKEGKEKLVTETGAGQWGTALAYAAKLLGLDCEVFWVRNVYEWKKQRRILMKLYGANVHASPSDITEVGRKYLKKDPNHPGSLSIAIAEGLEYASKQDNATYALGSVLNHVLMHQTIIGLEAIEQFKKIDTFPDLVISCLGGGSNFGGIALPFIREKLVSKREIEFLAVQSEAAPNLVKGKYEYDFADVAGQTPLLKMYTLGHNSEFKEIKGDGLRYHAAAPIISLLREEGIIRAKYYPINEKEVFEAAKIFLESEGWLVAAESAYAVRGCIDEALKLEKQNKESVILMNISGHGFLDLDAYAEKLNLN
ncbi:MAG TPA: TrpB-like pyridoxal phosphate-dependent enzyme [Geobacterales bacterium]|nr:TrpB-like pyridoxal phosphate-dependent enzyme [Geobacterales bacterium]